MSGPVSLNTQATLLLTAPLIVGREARESGLLTPGEFNRLARALADDQREPADLLGPEAGELLNRCQTVADGGRLEKLLGRGFLLSQAMERWEARSIWVVSRLDVEYPGRLKARLKEAAPAVLYGCGEVAVLETGGLAVVGSRDVSEALVEYAEGIGRLAARARRTVVSGAAKGIDQAAMRGALQSGGRVVGVLSDSLERAALVHEHREFIMEDRLTLVCPYDPKAGFSVGQAMQRNKLIYALSDAALVVSSGFETGGTWAGATEQLDKLRLVPVYVRSDGVTEKGIKALQEKGARPWPDPSSPDEFVEALAANVEPTKGAPLQAGLPLSISEQTPPPYAAGARPSVPPPEPPSVIPLETLPLGEQLFAKVKELLLASKFPKTESQVASELGVGMGQAREWLRRLVEEGALEKVPRSAGYRLSSHVQGSLPGLAEKDGTH